MQQQAQYETQDVNILYSRDGKYLYASEPTGVLALDALTGAPAGYQGLVTASLLPNSLWDTDENNRVYGIIDQGAFASSVAQLQPTAPVMPTFPDSSFGVGISGEGPLAGGSQVQLVPTSIGAGSADGISSTMKAYLARLPLPPTWSPLIPLPPMTIRHRNSPAASAATV